MFPLPQIPYFSPFACVAFAGLIMIAAWGYGIVALVLRPFAEQRAIGRASASMSFFLSLFVLALDMCAAPGTNIPERIYKLAIITFALGVLAIAIYPRPI